MCKCNGGIRIYIEEGWRVSEMWEKEEKNNRMCS